MMKIYEVDEQVIQQKENEILQSLRTTFGDLSTADDDDLETTEAKLKKIRELIESDTALSTPEQKCLSWNVQRIVLSPLDALVHCAFDAAVHSSDATFIWLFGRWTKTDIVFRNQNHLRQNIDRFAKQRNLTLDASRPMASMRLGDGTLLEIIVPPLAADGPVVTIEREHKIERTFKDLMGGISSVVRDGQLHEFTKPAMLTENMVNVLKACVQGRLNIIVSGGPRSGKSTVLNSLSQYINPRQRTVVIEERQELNVPVDCLLRLQPLPQDWTGERAIDTPMLVRKAFRMMQDIVITGELKGNETFDLISTMGDKSGVMTTVLADTPRKCLLRLEDQMLRSHPNLTSTLARHLIVAAAPVIVQVNQLDDGTRRITQIVEVQGLNDGSARSEKLLKLQNLAIEQIRENDFILNTLFYLQRMGRDQRGFFKVQFSATGRPPVFLEKLEREAVMFKFDWLKPESDSVTA